jgi:hypothetical protein
MSRVDDFGMRSLIHVIVERLHIHDPDGRVVHDLSEIAEIGLLFQRFADRLTIADPRDDIECLRVSSAIRSVVCDTLRERIARLDPVLRDAEKRLSESAEG